MCGLYVLCLSALAAAAQENDDNVSTPLVIDAVSRAVIDPQFAHAVTDRLCITRMAVRETIKA